MKILPRAIHGNDVAAYWEDFLPEEDIDFLKERCSLMAKKQAEIGDGVVQLDVRRTKVSFLDFNEESLPIYGKIADAFSRINSQFFRCDLDCLGEEMQLGHYTAKEKSHYDWHTDQDTSSGQIHRKLSMCLMLSDPKDFRGGHLQILNGKDPQNLEQKKGRAWFFPSYVLHRVTPVTKGVRQSAVVWATGEPWR